jgi:hypothetical protein
LMTERQSARLWLAAKALLTVPQAQEMDGLRRMALDRPANQPERLLRGLVVQALRAERAANA